MTYYVTNYDVGGADDDEDEKMVDCHLTAAEERRSVFNVERSAHRRERILT